MTGEEFDWTAYYAELMKAKAARWKWGAVGILIGISMSVCGFYILVQYLNQLP